MASSMARSRPATWRAAPAPTQATVLPSATRRCLRPAEIEAAFVAADMVPTTYLFRDGSEAIVVGRRA